MLNKVAASVLGAGFVLMSAQAFAGEWKFNPRACPDLVEDRFDRIEDRRDTRVNNGRRDRIEDRYDRRENRRDSAVTICPIRAFYYVPDRRELRRADYRGKGKAYGRHRANLRPPLSYDRRMRMYYRYDNGRKIYVRG
jgi:hypothetical protein